MAAINNLVSMHIAAAAWLLALTNGLVRASTRLAAQPPGALLR
ncbi:MAG: hypothetical protein ACREDH_09000 [Methylocella sp.]